METVLRQAGFPEIYERLLVPSIFAPWARELIERARPIGPSDRILDLGCGTGIVARTLRERLGAAANITGVDANSGMVAMARSLAPDIAWHEANAMQLPFPDASFELVVSQQMLQFVPDRAAAAREIRRVLAPGGRLVASTWRPRGEQPLYETLGVIAERHLGPGRDPRFSFGDPDALRALFSDAGLADISVEIVSRVDHYRDIAPRMVIMPAHDLQALPADEREARLAAFDAEAAAAVQPFASDGGYATEDRACFVVAHRR